MKNNNRLLYLLIFILFVWCLILSSQNNARRQEISQSVVNQYEVDGFSTDLTAVVDEVRAGVVSISADNNLLSGFVYKQEGDSVYILSAYHGVANVSSITVRFGSSYSVPGELIGHDIYLDLAVIRVNTPYIIEPLKTGDSIMLKRGEFLIAMGTPSSLDFQGSVELCMVSASGIQIENSILVEDERYNYFLSVIEVGNLLPSGYSGSPLINMNGDVVGMITMSTQGTSTLALTINEMKMAADQLMDGQQIERKILGMKGTFLKDMYNYEKTNLNIAIEAIDGFYVERIRENGLAYQAGIRTGDVITKINGEDIIDLNSYLRAIYSDSAELNIEYIRNSQTEMVSLVND